MLDTDERNECRFHRSSQHPAKVCFVQSVTEIRVLIVIRNFIHEKIVENHYIQGIMS